MYTCNSISCISLGPVSSEDSLGFIVALVAVLLAFFVLVLITISSIAVAIRNSKAKAKLMKELKAQTTVYEDITDLKQQPQMMETSDNVAYATTK